MFPGLSSWAKFRRPCGLPTEAERPAVITTSTGSNESFTFVIPPRGFCKMKIGITCYPTYGGSGVVATELGIELAARGHQVHFITYSRPFRLTGREEGISYHEVPVSNYPLFEYPPYDLALATRMSEVAEYYELDLLH